MSPFTDDDLKRLKEWTVYCENKFNGNHLDDMTFVREFSYTEVKTLLDRLELAEQIVDHCMKNHDDGDDELEEVWRKAAGI